MPLISPVGFTPVFAETQRAKAVRALAEGPQAPTSTFTAAASMLDFLGIAAAANAGMKAYAAGDTLGASQSLLEVSKGSLIDMPKYALTGLQKSTQLAQILPDNLVQYLPASDPKLITFLQGTTVTNVLGGLGALTSFLGILVEGHNLVRQNDVDTCLKKTDLLQTLKNLKTGLNPNAFFRSLPEYLREKIGAEGGKDLGLYLDQLIEEVEKYDTKMEAETFVARVEKGVIRQKVVHVLGLVACIIGLAASIALLIGCPVVVLTLLTIVGVAFTATSVVLKKSWVEHDGDGLKLKLLLPEFLRSTDEVVDTELSILQHRPASFFEEDTDEDYFMPSQPSQTPAKGFFERVTSYLAGFAEFFTS